MTKGKLGGFEFSDAALLGDTLLESQAQFRMAQTELAECNKKQEDLLHQLELLNLSYHEMARLAKELRDVRRRRRVAKNTIELTRPLNEWTDSHSTAVNRLYNAIGELRRVSDAQSNAVYKLKTVEGEVIKHFDCYENSQE